MVNNFSINKTLHLGIFLIIILGSCTKADHFYKDYIIERTYVGKIDSVKIMPGENRMKLLWLNSKDLSAKNLIVYWNDKKDSVLTPINNKTDTSSFIIDNLEEGDYTFNIVSTDAKGNRSLPIEKNTTIYGKTYKNGLINQGIDHVVLFKDSAVILWNYVQVEPLLLGNEIEYTDKDNKKQVVFAPLNSLITTIYNVDTAKIASARSLYKPDPKALDDIYSKTVEYKLSEMQVHSLRLVSNSSWEEAEFIDFKLVRVFKADEIPSPQAQDIDLSHLRGGGSKHNLFTINSPNFSAFASSYQASVDAWDIQNKAEMIFIGGGTEANAIYDGLDANDIAAMEQAYQNAENVYGAGTDRLTKLNTGDIVLIHSEDRELYVAIKVAYSEPDGIMDLEFKVTRP